ncbi:MAG: hypothetical protein KI790_14765 [Cyclobacteriaceae bacterium]|nr:hypothetical protein [Cyclobacteriaceae bacterium HetDA_MAG_MS6]
MLNQLPMKFISQLLLLSLPLLASAQLEQTWIAVESRQVTTDFISPIDGTIFDFGKDSLHIKNVFSDTAIVKNYVLRNNQIAVNDSAFAVIKHISSDSLLLEFDEWMLSVFYPLEPVMAPEINRHELLGSTWTLDFEGFKQSWNFTDSPAEHFKHDESKICVSRNAGEFTNGSTEYWNLTNFKNRFLLTLTMGQFDKQIYQVVSTSSDTFLLKPISNWLIDEVRFFKVSSLPQVEFERFSKSLTAKHWKTTEILNNSPTTRIGDLSESQLDSVDMDKLSLSGGSYAAWFDTLLITKQQFFSKQVSYQFNADFTYCISLSNNQYDCGTWQLLEDGTIKLDEGWGHEQYITIEEITDTKLVLSNCNQFSIQPQSNDYNVICYTIQLE